MQRPGPWFPPFQRPFSQLLSVIAAALSFATRAGLCWLADDVFPWRRQSGIGPRALRVLPAVLGNQSLEAGLAGIDRSILTPQRPRKWRAPPPAKVDCRAGRRPVRRAVLEARIIECASQAVAMSRYRARGGRPAPGSEAETLAARFDKSRAQEIGKPLPSLGRRRSLPVSTRQELRSCG